MISMQSTRVKQFLLKKEPNLSFVIAKIQQNCTDTGNDNSEATRQKINCAVYPSLINSWMRVTLFKSNTFSPF